MLRSCKALVLLLVTSCSLAPLAEFLAQSAYFSKWPAGTSPQEVGKRVAENFVARQLEFEQGKRQYVIYPEVCAAYGSLSVAQLTGDNDLKSRLIRKFDSLSTPEGAKQYCAGTARRLSSLRVVPLEIYMQTRERKFLDLGIGLADMQWQKTTPDGITAEARYWIDDMYMITAVQIQAFRATGDTNTLTRAATTMAAYLDKLQQSNGLSFTRPTRNSSGTRQWLGRRGNDGTTSLAAKEASQRARSFVTQKMMASLLKYAGSDGLWRRAK